LNAKEVAGMIDISAVRTHHSLEDIKYLVEIAEKYRFINVHVLPSWVSILAPMLKDIDGVYVGAPVGFPGGSHRTETKLLEAMLLIEDGVQEMDIVMNVGKFKNREYDYVLRELKQIVGVARESETCLKTKILIELNCLKDSELPKVCEIVAQSGADFLKTGTGWVPGDANIERIAKIRELLDPRVKIKAAGGIRTKEEFLKLLDIGVERFGINTKSAMEIVKAFE